MSLADDEHSDRCAEDSAHERESRPFGGDTEHVEGHGARWDFNRYRQRDSTERDQGPDALPRRYLDEGYRSDVWFRSS